MAEITLDKSERQVRVSGGRGIWLKVMAIAWRNLWRNRRRTWLTVSGIAFAVFLLVFARAMQDGSFATMVDNGARMMPGHVQVQHMDYHDSPQMENTLAGRSVVDALVATGDFEFVSERAQGFALVSAGEKSFGAQIIGIEPQVEGQWSKLATSRLQGRFLQNPGEVFIGEILARNIGVAVGDEVVVLGTAKEGGVAALALDVVGIVTTGIADLDRGIALVDIDDFRDAWAMAADESHAVVGIGKTLLASELGLAEVALRDSAHHYLNWRDLMPDAEQMWDMKVVSTEVMFYVIAIIVGFSVVNTFMMLVFERTSEMGVLMAIGMKPLYLVGQLQIEAFLVAAVGVAVGAGLAAGLIIPLSGTGMPFPIEGLEGMLRQYNMPERLYPTFDASALVLATAIMVIGTQIAAFIPGTRIFRLRPVEAIRQET